MKNWYAKVETPTLPKKRHTYVFASDLGLMDGGIEQWLEQMVEAHLWDIAKNQPTQFSILEFGTLVGRLVEVK